MTITGAKRALRLIRKSDKQWKAKRFNKKLRHWPTSHKYCPLCQAYLKHKCTGCPFTLLDGDYQRGCVPIIKACNIINSKEPMFMAFRLMVEKVKAEVGMK